MGRGPNDLTVAMRFLRAAREDPALAERLRAFDPAGGLEPFVAVAAEAGFDTTVEDLRAAHVHDWALRRAHYATADSAATTVAVVKTASSST